jgi:hypothetical protein
MKEYLTPVAGTDPNNFTMNGGLWGVDYSTYHGGGDIGHDLALAWDVSLHGENVRSDIQAPLGGTIAEVFEQSGNAGIVIKIHDDNGYFTWLGHLTNAYVAPGARVEQGQIIGYIETPQGGLTHTHYMISTDGAFYTNTLTLINARVNTVAEIDPPQPILEKEKENMFLITFKGAKGVWLAGNNKITALETPDNLTAMTSLLAHNNQQSQPYEYGSFAWFLRAVDSYLGTGDKYFKAGKELKQYT